MSHDNKNFIASGGIVQRASLGGIFQKGILQKRSFWNFGKYSQSKRDTRFLAEIKNLLLILTEPKKKVIGGRYCNCNCFIQDFFDNCRDKTGGKLRLHGITYNHSSGCNSIYVSRLFLQ